MEELESLEKEINDIRAQREKYQKKVKDLTIEIECFDTAIRLKVNYMQSEELEKLEKEKEGTMDQLNFLLEDHSNPINKNARIEYEESNNRLEMDIKTYTESNKELQKKIRILTE